jgi:hypothetical protein
MAEVKFRVGDRVKFRIGIRIAEGVVKEDRGPIGVKGRRLYTVEFCPDPVDPDQLFRLELPAVDMELVQGKVSTGSNK